MKLLKLYEVQFSHLRTVPSRVPGGPDGKYRENLNVQVLTDDPVRAMDVAIRDKVEPEVHQLVCRSKDAGIIIDPRFVVNPAPTT